MEVRQCERNNASPDGNDGFPGIIGIFDHVSMPNIQKAASQVSERKRQS
jgi:hypothetical protein